MRYSAFNNILEKYACEDYYLRKQNLFIILTLKVNMLLFSRLIIIDETISIVLTLHNFPH